MRNQITTNAIKIIQGGETPVFSFFLKGQDILKIADISRIEKNGEGKLLGYQRGEVLSHVNEIVNFLDSEKVLFPNAIILAMSSEVEFVIFPSGTSEEFNSSSGVLRIPIKKIGSKPAWIVDGQQRTMALSRCSSNDIIVPVIGFVSDDLEVHRSQFLLINKVRPLPSGLINELLPEISTLLPQSLARNQIPSTLCDLLCEDPNSPFYKIVRRVSTPKSKRKSAVITDNSLLQVIRTSLNSVHGCLYRYRNVASGEVDLENCKKLLVLYWSGVKETFPEAWGKEARVSRLMHGVGIKAMGNLMDRVMSNIRPDDSSASESVDEALESMRECCAWTKGTWDELNGIPWNQLQNTPRDVKLLSNFLIRVHMGVTKV